jgi:hypothetical protein
MGTLPRMTRVLDMEDFTYFNLDKEHLRELIQSDLILLTAFEAEDRRETKIYEYFLKFVERKQ